MESLYYLSPLGPIRITGSEEGIRSVIFSDHFDERKPKQAPHCLYEAREQLHEYFCHQRHTFDLELDFHGSSFQKKVWRALADIPWGKTRTYTEIADIIGQPEAHRTVGAANGQNPFLIILPCHRVLGTNGLLTGYAGGLLRKKWLLQHEMQSERLIIFA